MKMAESQPHSFTEKQCPGAPEVPFPSQMAPGNRRLSLLCFHHRLRGSLRPGAPGHPPPGLRLTDWGVAPGPCLPICSVSAALGSQILRCPLRRSLEVQSGTWTDRSLGSWVVGVATLRAQRRAVEEPRTPAQGMALCHPRKASFRRPVASPGTARGPQRDLSVQALRACGLLLGKTVALGFRKPLPVTSGLWARTLYSHSPGSGVSQGTSAPVMPACAPLWEGRGCVSSPLPPGPGYRKPLEDFLNLSGINQSPRGPSSRQACRPRNP